MAASVPPLSSNRQSNAGLDSSADAAEGLAADHGSAGLILDIGSSSAAEAEAGHGSSGLILCIRFSSAVEAEAEAGPAASAAGAERTVLCVAC